MQRWNLKDRINSIIILIMCKWLIEIEPLNLLNVDFNQAFNRLFIKALSNIFQEFLEELAVW